MNLASLFSQTMTKNIYVTLLIFMRKNLKMKTSILLNKIKTDENINTMDLQNQQ